MISYPIKNSKAFSLGNPTLVAFTDDGKASLQTVGGYVCDIPPLIAEVVSAIQEEFNNAVSDLLSGDILKFEAQTNKNRKLFSREFKKRIKVFIQLNK